MPKFDTRVQELRYRIIKEITKHTYTDDLVSCFYDIPKVIVPGPAPSMRCCIYKERAIVQERIKLTMDASSTKDSNPIRVIPIACDECPLGGYIVGDACRGCIAHRCSEACPKDAITFGIHDRLRASIDKNKCINCGLCAKACPYNAIENRIRPCEKACKNKAISPDPVTNAAHINDDNCIHCGACVYMCPFGAIVDESYILDIVKMLREEKHVYAVVAPSIAGNFTEYKLNQVITAIKKLGFSEVIEAALGADIVALNESKELSKEGKLLSSCCPSFVTYIKKNFPTLAKHISTSLSPMATISKLIKEKNPTCKIVFIGPCTSKKYEIKLETVKPYVDSALTFEELQALIDNANIDIGSLKGSSFYKIGSKYGRGFAKCGGLSNAVKKALEESNIDFKVNGLACSGIKEIRNALNDMKNGTSDVNFIEGMMCDGGCIGGPCNLNHQMKNKILIDKYSQEASTSIQSTVNEIDLD